MKKRFHQIELFIKYPYEVQCEWMLELINTAASTEYGKKYDFKNIKNYQDFKNKIPISNYENLHPYIEKAMCGEKNILWPGLTNNFAKSSGTTQAKSKFIPVTSESLEHCHYKGGKDMLTIYCNNNENSKLFTGKNLALGGSLAINDLRKSSDSYSGDLSAIIMKGLPFWAEFYRTPHKDVAMLNDWELKLNKLYETCVNENIISLSGVPSWMMVLANYILEQTKQKNLIDVWPQLEVFFYGGINIQPYSETFNNIIPQKEFNYYQLYNASEGFFGLQMENKADDMLLMLDYGVFYEFAAIDELGNINEQQVVMIDDVKLNKTYALIITTNAGLWRYMIGDTIQFTSLNPFKFKITGRTKHFINAFGEELMVHNADQAIDNACKIHNLELIDYTAAPYIEGDKKKGYHTWLIEFKNQPKEINDFAITLDKELKKLNSDYEAKRQSNLLLQLPQIIVARPNTFYNWLKNNNRLGGQYKVPRLSNNTNILNEILKIHQEL